MPVHILKITTSETTAQLSEYLGRAAAEPRRAANDLARYLEALAGGVLKGSLAFGTDSVKAYGTAVFDAVVADDVLTVNGVGFTAKAKYASNIVTAASVQVGDTVTINSVVLTAIANGESPTAAQFALGTGGTADTDTAHNIAAAITAATATTLCTATHTNAAVTISANAEGAAGNNITIATSNGTRLAITTAGGKLAGAYVPASNQFPVESTQALTAAACAARINASATAKISGYVTAAAPTSTLTVTAVNPGISGNLFSLAQTGNHITVAAAALANGSEGTVVTYDLT